MTPKDKGYRSAVLAAVCAGLASFNALYATQAILPDISAEFGVSPSIAALTVSATTGALALSLIPVGIASERWGRRRVMQYSIICATLMSLLLAIAPSAESLIALRAIQGIAVAGVPAVAMVYLAEEVAPEYLPKVMGMYVAGTSLGGLSGRLIPGVVLEVASWRVALVCSAAFAIGTGVLTAWKMPASQNFEAKRITVGHELRALRSHLAEPRLVKLFALAFLFMGGFVSLYNYLGFRLTEDFGLAPSVAALVFVLYLSGTWSSARAGNFVRRWGRGKVLVGCVVMALIGLCGLLVSWLPLAIVATLVFTASFFAAHSVASGWVGAVATHDRAEASSMYMLLYYVGSSVVGWVSGYFFHMGWATLVGWLIGLYAVALLLALRLMTGSRRRARAAA